VRQEAADDRCALAAQQLDRHLPLARIAVRGVPADHDDVEVERLVSPGPTRNAVRVVFVIELLDQCVE
jgi:hypothetical protein